MRNPRNRLAWIYSLIRRRRHPLDGLISKNVSRRQLFTSTASLRVLAHSTNRPHLSFPLTPFGSRRTTLAPRFISTEQKQQFKYNLKIAIYYSTIGWVLIGAYFVAYAFFRQEWLDRLYPSPSEWNLVIKYHWRIATHEVATEGIGRGVIDWARVGVHYRNVVSQLEDFRLILHRPSNLLTQDTWDPTLPCIDANIIRTPPGKSRDDEQLWPKRIGYDITMKSEAWRRGYFEAMMGLCKGAEMIDGYLTSAKTGLCYPPENVRSASNPYPRPLAPGVPSETPNEEDCYPTLEKADFHYVRLLTTNGFTRRQRMDGGIAYALWLDHTGRNEMAEAMYRWSLDLALAGVHDEKHATIDPRTAVISANAPYVTPNILSSAEALASFRARTGDIPAALSIYLSTLRARRSAPTAPRNRQYPPPKPDLSLKNVDSVIGFITSLPFRPEVPYPPPSGDQVFERTTMGACEEAALMAYVGEILFAKGGRQEDGLAWTRDATHVAEDKILDKKLDDKGRKTCQQCLHTGLENWCRMVAQLSREKNELEDAARSKPRIWFSWDNDRENWLREGDWKTEEMKIRSKLGKLEDERAMARLNAMISSHSSWLVI